MFPYNSFYSIDLGLIKIQAWGLLVAIGFLVGIYFAVKEAKRRKEDPEHIYNIFVYILIGAFIFSRLLFVLQNWSSFSSDLLSILKLWEGGLSFHGGLIGALLLGGFYVWKNKLKFWKFADICAPSLAIGHFFGRIGCILGDGGHLGKLTTVPWGALYQGEVRHLTAMYEAIGLLIIFAILFYLRKKEKFNGFLFSIYAVSYGLFRFVNDFYRADPTYFGLTMAQYFSVLLFCFGIYLLIKKGWGELK